MHRLLRSNHAFSWLLVSLALAATGCVNLEPVREFAKVSTEAAAYTALVDQYIEVPEASVRYIKANPSARDVPVEDLEAKIEERKAQRAPLLALHASLTNYMAAIGTLASDNLVKTDKEFKALQQGVGKFAKSAGLDAETKGKLNAAGALLKLVANAALKQYQRRQVIDIMTDANGYVVAITEYMTTLIPAPKLDLKVQRVQLEELFDKFPGGEDAKPPRTTDARALAFLVAEERRERLIALDQLGKQTDQYAELLTGIANAHNAFVENPVELSRKELFGELKAHSNELKVLFQAVKEPLIGLLPAELMGVTL